MKKVKYPRLGQPLFDNAYGKMYHEAASDPILMSFIRAYDQIWNLMYQPKDIRSDDVFKNGEINLESLGRAIEQAFGEQVFIKTERSNATTNQQKENEMDNHSI